MTQGGTLTDFDLSQTPSTPDTQRPLSEMEWYEQSQFLTGQVQDTLEDSESIALISLEQITDTFV